MAFLYLGPTIKILGVEFTHEDHGVYADPLKYFGYGCIANDPLDHTQFWIMPNIVISQAEFLQRLITTYHIRA